MTRPVALITGLGRPVGIAAGIARTLATEGWDLAVTHWAAADDEIFGATATDGLAAVVDELRAAGARVASIPADLERADAAAAVIAEARAQLGTVEALVLSHAWDVDSGLLDTTVEQFDKHFAVNTRASWLLIAEFARQVDAGGTIVALTSDHTAGNLPYGASKGARPHRHRGRQGARAARHLGERAKPGTGRHGVDDGRDPRDADGDAAGRTPRHPRRRGGCRRLPRLDEGPVDHRPARDERRGILDLHLTGPSKCGH
jgi:hypothetical protein